MNRLFWILIKIAILLAIALAFLSLKMDIDNLESRSYSLEYIQTNDNIDANSLQITNCTNEEIEILVMNNTILLELNETITREIQKLQKDLQRTQNKIESLYDDAEEPQEAIPTTITEILG